MVEPCQPPVTVYKVAHTLLILFQIVRHTIGVVHTTPVKNFNDINTVQDLISENEKESPSVEILKKVYQLDPADGLDIVMDILENIKGFHNEVIKECVKENQIEKSLVWTYDMSVIDQCINSLKDVEL